MAMSGVIYKIENKITNELYVGSSSSGLKKRMYSHLYLLRKNKHHSPILQSVFHKYGEQSFLFSEIENSIQDNKSLLQREQFYIDSLKPKYNICPVAGNTKNRKATNDSKIKVAQTLKLMYATGELKHTEESTRKKVLANTGQKRSIEQKERISTSKSKYKIIQYDKESLSVVQEFANIKECEKYFKLRRTQLDSILRKPYGIIGDYVIRYENKAPLHYTSKGRLRSISQYDSNMEKIGDYYSIAEAEKRTGIDHRMICKKLKNGKLINNFYFKYNN